MEIQSMRRPLAADWLRKASPTKSPEQHTDEVMAEVLGINFRALRHMDVAQVDVIRAALLPVMLPVAYRVTSHEDGVRRVMVRCECCDPDECDRDPPCGLWVRCVRPDLCECEGEELFTYKPPTVGDAMDCEYDNVRLLAWTADVKVAEMEQWPLWKYRTLEMADLLDRRSRQKDFTAPPFV